MYTGTQGARMSTEKRIFREKPKDDNPKRRLKLSPIEFLPDFLPLTAYFVLL